MSSLIKEQKNKLELSTHENAQLNEKVSHFEEKSEEFKNALRLKEKGLCDIKTDLNSQVTSLLEELDECKKN